ncbi:MAG: SMC family ATPase [Lachnospiraceae bacterium]|nr:SMC family ATPase [Lachnospiraceae bacterium]
MRPIKLTISAIGPFAGEMPPICFEQFEDSGIFLISGDTGAGKTTIFDAICYALFGVTSGSYRDTKQLRSDYADAATESFVEFCFSHQGREYRIRRKPAYARKKLNGSGMTKPKPEEAVLEEKGEVPIEGLKKVNDAVEALLGINAQQFKQIAMIAQGEFRELLTASTGDRTKILRSIFMTEGYDRIGDLLKARVDQSSQAKAEHERSIIQHFHDVRAGEPSEELEALQKKSEESGNAWNLEEMLALIDRLTEQDRKQLEELDRELQTEGGKLDLAKKQLALAQSDNELLKSLAELKEEREKLLLERPAMEERERLLQKQKGAVYKVKPLWTRRNESAASCRKLEADIRNHEEKREAALRKKEAARVRAERAEAERPVLQEQELLFAKLQEEMPKYQERESLRRQIHDAQKKLHLVKEKQGSAEKEEQSLQLKVQELQVLMDERRGLPEEKIRLQHECEKMQKRAEELDDFLIRRVPEREKRKAKLGKLQAQYESCRKNFEHAESARAEAERTLEYSRAGMLAKLLTEGEPCPVCGSTSHPKPAVLPPHCISEEEYKTLQAGAEEKRKEKESALAKVEAEHAAFREAEQHLTGDLQRSLEDREPKAEAGAAEITAEEKTAGTEQLAEELLLQLPEARTAAHSACEELRRKIAGVSAGCAELAKAEAERRELDEQTLPALRKQKEQLAGQEAEYEKQLAGFRTALDGLKDLRHEQLQDAREEFALAEQRIAAMRQEAKEAAEEEKRSLESISALEAALAEQRKTLQTTAAETERLSSELTDLRTSCGFESEEELQSCFVTEAELAAGEKLLKDYEKAFDANKLKLEQTEEQTAGKKWTDLEELRESIAAKEAEHDQHRKAFHETESRIRSNTEKRSLMEKQKDALAKAEKELRLSTRLYKLVRGQTGNEKITLEQYIQASGFDNIIAAANKRLLPMTEMQYELSRKTSDGGKRTDTFLDLEVEDHYTGKRRAVGNLSGGESFKASLSLALGLSDTVSSEHGGIQMDALFIDEGFGTLDRKSIENAMDILQALSETDRLVGIISHREELAESIPQQIRVEKTRTGSRFFFETE